MTRALLRNLAFSLMLIAPLVRADDAPEAPATKPQQAESQAKVSPEAKKVLEQLTAAYGKLTSLELAGKTSFDADVAGKPDHFSDPFTASFAAPNKFRHEMKGNMVAGSTGQKAYVFSVEDNAYVQKDAPKERVAMSDAPMAIWEVIAMQDPSLAMALSADAGRQLLDGATAFAAGNVRDTTPGDVEKATEVKAVEGEKVGEKAFDALKLTNPAGEFTFLIDPETHLLRRVTIDQRALLKKIGQPDVKQAQITIDYEKATPDAKVADGQFAWAAPANARELTAAAVAPRDEGGEGAATALVGKAAPEFKLPDLGGKDVKLSDLKGSVVVVDFWATWCPPCVESLPHLEQLYQEKKEAGLKVLAVSVDQDKQKVPPFVTDKKLTFTVLLDNEEQKAAEKYGVQGIPQTVVIGKDGKVAKVFVGFGPGSEGMLKKAVEEAMK
jgi:peroxiredoxin